VNPRRPKRAPNEGSMGPLKREEQAGDDFAGPAHSLVRRPDHERACLCRRRHPPLSETVRERERGVPSLSLCLCLCLAHTPTHPHTHTYTHSLTKFRRIRSFDALTMKEHASAIEGTLPPLSSKCHQGHGQKATPLSLSLPLSVSISLSLSLCLSPSPTHSLMPSP